MLLESVTKNKLWAFLPIPVKECHFYGVCLRVEWSGRQDSEAMAVRVSRVEGTVRLGVLTGGKVLIASVSVLGLTASSMSIMLKSKG